MNCINSTSQCDEYFDTTRIDPSRISAQDIRCPVRNCESPLSSAPSQWGDMPFCPRHGIRIHPKSRKFVYYNGPTQEDRKRAILRNIVFEKEYFAKFILGSQSKAETHRICFETSEDAVTWNVFSSLARHQKLKCALSYLVGEDIGNEEPELYLWGHRIDLSRCELPTIFRPLLAARDVFEPDIRRYLTEPDLMLFIPDRLFVVVEIKFTSGNTVAKNVEVDEGEKPKSKRGILGRYKASFLPQGVLNPDGAVDPFYPQLYRNLVFAIHMANTLHVDWRLSNLVSGTQWRKIRSTTAEFLDPTNSIKSVLSDAYNDRFSFRTWEELRAHCIKNVLELLSLSGYMQHKTARMEKAFELK